MVYSNADITKTEQSREIIAFADYWQQATGSDPGLLVFDSQLTTYKGRVAWGNLTPRLPQSEVDRRRGALGQVLFRRSLPEQGLR
jgi:hypothetical protein